MSEPKLNAVPSGTDYPHRMRLSHAPTIHAIRTVSDHPESPIETACGLWVGFTGDERLTDDVAVTCDECAQVSAAGAPVRPGEEPTT
jgi:hypothetical protein